jgi:hypothetical protein
MINHHEGIVTSDSFRDSMEALNRMDDAIRLLGQELAKLSPLPDAANAAWRNLQASRENLENALRQVS